MVELTQSFMIPLVRLLILQFIIWEGCLLFKFRVIALRLRSFTLKKKMVFLDLLQLLVGLLVNPV